MLHRNLDGANTGVEVKDGRVILQGEVNNQAEKELTAEYVKDVEGVKDVDNKMTVGKAPAKIRQTLGEYIDDAAITAKIKTGIFEDQRLKSLQIEVKTFKGVVQLSGFVDSSQSVVRAGEIAGSIAGIKELKNDLVVK